MLRSYSPLGLEEGSFPSMRSRYAIPMHLKLYMALEYDRNEKQREGNLPISHPVLI